MEQQTSKNQFRLNGGLNTEINELNFPDGFTTDEANYELLLDGSRRRRKGLALESGGSSKAVGTWRDAEVSQTYTWKNVGGDPTKTVTVFRKGDTLYFADESETLSSGWATGGGSAVSLEAFYTSGATTANVADAPITMTNGRGYLVVGGQYLYPFYVSYDSTTGYYSSTIINVKCRDFTDVEDGVAITTHPTSATITDSHLYNLLNRGWSQGQITAHDSALSKWPAKNTIRWRGYKRVADQSTAASVELDGTRAMDYTKLDAEAFGNSSAPKGAMFLSPYDTTTGYGLGATGTGVYDVSSWTIPAFDPTWPFPSTWTIEITTNGNHGLTAGDQFEWRGSSFIYTVYVASKDLTIYGVENNFDGLYTTQSGTGVAGSLDKIYITVDVPGNFYAWENQFLTLGEANIGSSVTRGSGTVHTDGLKAVEFHDGRFFYTGMTNTEWADTIFFSQLADSPDKFGRCYQAADPTDENYNALVPTDGGTIIIPGLSGIQNLVSIRNALIVLTLDGVYEISGGRQGYFTAGNYSVRKLSEAGCSSATGYTRIENTVVYSGPGGIYIIAPNQYTGALEVTNTIEQTIQSLWNAIPDAQQERVQMFYDDALKRVYILYGPDASSHYITTALIFNVKASAWFKYTFTNPSNNGLLCGVALTTVDDPEDGKKVKFFYESDTTNYDDVSIADFAQTGYDDWHGANGPLPYLYTGWDNIGDFQRRRQAPIITVFSKRTETGFTGSDPVTPVNPSSTIMSGLWDWVADNDTTTGGDSNEADTNKITATQQVYRHTRAFAPSATTDLDGYTVVVTRNKLRGRGRVLQLKFKGEEDKDSHILGFTTNYKVTRKK